MTRCGRCGEQNPARARFCAGCGAALQTAQEAPEPEERKVVSVLFCDLVGFTARSDRADPEEVRAVLRPYHLMLRTVLERFGGTVEKFIGDAVMAVFGAPAAHEDDAERAARAGLAILEAVRGLAVPSGVDPLAVRLGIATGEVLVSLGARPVAGEGMVFGDVVNTAARLQTAAPVGGIVIDESTFQLTQEVIRCVELEPVAVKGKADPLPIWRVVRAPGRSETSAARAAAPLVGRDAELELLQNTFTGVAQDRSVRLVTITGEPGVGKSRLVAELFAAVDAGPEPAVWRQGRCLPYGDGVTFWALGEIVKAQAGILDTDDLHAASGKLSQAVAAIVDDPGDRWWIAAMLSPLVGLTVGEQAATREETFTGWRRFFEALAGRQPLVLVAEDLHWADPALLEFLDHLRGACTGVPLLVVGTARPELYERLPGWGDGEPNSVGLALSALSKIDTAKLVAALLGAATLPAETQALLLEKSGGNPLYAEQFIRLLNDRGLPHSRDRTAWDTAQPVPVPGTVQALIAARLDTLEPQDKVLLHAAAVVGRVFWPGAVAAITGSDESAVRVRLQELAGKGFLYREPESSVHGQAEYVFWHELFRDISYGQIPRLPRAAKHQITANWLEDLAADRVADYAEVLAHHYGQALALVTAAGTEPVDHLVEATRRFLVLAGDRATHLDPGAADAHYHHALELFPAEHPGRPAVQKRAAWAAGAAGDTEAAMRGYEKAAEVSLKLGNSRAAGSAKAELANLYWDRGDTSSARALLGDAFALLRNEGPCAELAHVLELLAFEAWTAGRADEDLRWSAQILDIADATGLEEIRGLGLMERGRARLDLDDPQGIEDIKAAVVATRRALEHDKATTHGSWYLLNWQCNLVEALWLAEGTTAALNAGLEAKRIAIQRGLLHPFTAVRADGLKVLFDSGRWDDLLRSAREVTTQRTSQGGDYWSVIADIQVANVLVHRRQLTSAADLLAQALPQARSIGDLQVYGSALEVAASSLLANGNLHQAVTTVREFAEAADQAPTRRAWHLPPLVRVCTAAGELALAERLIEGTDLRLRRHACAHRAARAMLAEAHGAFDQAIDSYEQAATTWREYGHMLEHGYALLGAGRCASRRGDPAAAERLRTARNLFAALGAQPLGIADTGGHRRGRMP
jgi:class 3 adenylate cyclase/tetratricopeptide (TPR) repeat protein